MCLWWAICASGDLEGLRSEGWSSCLLVEFGKPQLRESVVRVGVWEKLSELNMAEVFDLQLIVQREDLACLMNRHGSDLDRYWKAFLGAMCFRSFTSANIK